MAQLSREVDCALDLNCLDIAVVTFPRDAEARDFFDDFFVAHDSFLSCAGFRVIGDVVVAMMYAPTRISSPAPHKDSHLLLSLQAHRSAPERRQFSAKRSADYWNYDLSTMRISGIR
jgi:hypothetical protein